MDGVIRADIEGKTNTQAVPVVANGPLWVRCVPDALVAQMGEEFSAGRAATALGGRDSIAFDRSTGRHYVSRAYLARVGMSPKEAMERLTAWAEAEPRLTEKLALYQRKPVNPFAIAEHDRIYVTVPGVGMDMAAAGGPRPQVVNGRVVTAADIVRTQLPNSQSHVEYVATAYDPVTGVEGAWAVRASEMRRNPEMRAFVERWSGMRAVEEVLAAKPHVEAVELRTQLCQRGLAAEDPQAIGYLSRQVLDRGTPGLLGVVLGSVRSPTGLGELHVAFEREGEMAIAKREVAVAGLRQFSRRLADEGPVKRGDFVHLPGNTVPLFNEAEQAALQAKATELKLGRDDVAWAKIGGMKTEHLAEKGYTSRLQRAQVGGGEIEAEFHRRFPDQRLEVFQAKARGEVVQPVERAVQAGTFPQSLLTQVRECRHKGELFALFDSIEQERERNRGSQMAGRIEMDRSVGAGAPALDDRGCALAVARAASLRIDPGEVGMSDDQVSRGLRQLRMAGVPVDLSAPQHGSIVGRCELVQRAVMERFETLYPREDFAQGMRAWTARATGQPVPVRAAVAQA